jgi:hypothetical protein
VPINFDLKKHLNPIFVETGTHDGHGVIAAMEAGFKRIISVELSPLRHFYTSLRRPVLDGIIDGRVSLVCGDSAVFLNSLVQVVREPCTFWLDAHAASFYAPGSLSVSDNPVPRELIALAKGRPGIHHTIFIDDIQDAGPMDEIQKLISFLGREPEVVQIGRILRVHL